MKKSLLTVIAVFVFLHLLAQPSPPQFGKIIPEDFNAKSASFDPDASAVCLLDLGENFYTITSRNISIQGEYRKRMQVLKVEGINRVADIKIRYYSKGAFEVVSGLTAFVYNLDESGNVVTTKLEKKQVYEKKINSDWTEISFALPEVKVGSIVEYKYKTYKSNSVSDIEDWTFQSDIPVVYSQYDLTLPEYFDFTYNIVRRQKVDIKPLSSKKGATRFAMQNIPALKYEPYMSSVKEYLQRVEFQLSAITWPGEQPKSYRTTWDKLGEELMTAEWFGKQINKNVHQLASLKEELKPVADPNDKLRIIYNYVQKNMSWNGNYARGAYEGIKDAWNKKTRSIADINFLLLNLLQDNDINAYPMLVSTRDNGSVNPLYPMLNQFNATYVYAVVGDKTYVMNAADKYNPSNIYPYDVQLTNGFVVKNRSPFVVFIEDAQTSYQHSCNMQLFVDHDGTISGKAVVESSGYGSNVRTKMYKDGLLKKAYIKGDLAEFNIDSIAVDNVGKEELPLKQMFHFSGKLKNSADYYFLPYNVFLGVSENPFITEKRQSAVDFGYMQSFTVRGFMSIDSSFDIEELPKNIRMILPDTSISLVRILQKNDGLINFQVSLSLRRERYEADEYPDLQMIYKKIFALLSENIALKKKS